MAQRTIDTTIHDLNAYQVMEQILRCFRDDSSDPIVIFTYKGKGEDQIRSIRVALSRMRKSRRDNGLSVTNFGFESIGPIPFNLDGLNKEGFMIKFKLTPLQLMRNLAAFSEVTL